MSPLSERKQGSCTEPHPVSADGQSSLVAGPLGTRVLANRRPSRRSGRTPENHAEPEQPWGSRAQSRAGLPCPLARHTRALWLRTAGPETWGADPEREGWAGGQSQPAAALVLVLSSAGERPALASARVRRRHAVFGELASSQPSLSSRRAGGASALPGLWQ